MGCRNPTSDDYRSRAGPRLLSIRPTSAHGTADPFDRDRGGPQRLTYPALDRCSRTGLAPSATTASSAAPGGFGNIVTPLEMQQEHLLQRASRSEIRSFVYICIAAGEVVQDTTLLPGRSPLRCRSALRRRADNPRAARQSGTGRHASRTGVEGSAHRDHGALLPRQHSRCAGVRGAERTSKEQRSDQAEANQETSTEEPVGLLRNMPTRDIGRSAPPCESMRRLQTPHRASPERARSDVACRRGWGRSAWMC